MLLQPQRLHLQQSELVLQRLHVGACARELRLLLVGVLRVLVGQSAELADEARRGRRERREGALGIREASGLAHVAELAQEHLRHRSLRLEDLQLLAHRPQLVGHPLALEAEEVGLLPRARDLHPRHLLVHAELLAEVGLLQVELAREEAVDAEAPRELEEEPLLRLAVGRRLDQLVEQHQRVRLHHQIVALADELEQPPVALLAARARDGERGGVDDLEAVGAAAQHEEDLERDLDHLGGGVVGRVELHELGGAAGAEEPLGADLVRERGAQRLQRVRLERRLRAVARQVDQLDHAALVDKLLGELQVHQRGAQLEARRLHAALLAALERVQRGGGGARRRRLELQRRALDHPAVALRQPRLPLLVGEEAAVHRHPQPKVVRVALARARRAVGAAPLPRRRGERRRREEGAEERRHVLRERHRRAQVVEGLALRAARDRQLHLDGHLDVVHGGGWEICARVRRVLRRLGSWEMCARVRRVLRRLLSSTEGRLSSQRAPSISSACTARVSSRVQSSHA